MTAWQHFEVQRKALAQTRLLAAEPPPLAEGEVRLRIDNFALTANTVTYALTGDVLGYWNFFPSQDAEWGRVPAMGWAELTESRHPALAVGTRYYGWFPMASHVDFQAQPTATGFRDDGPHRQAHAPIYRAYTATEQDPLYQPETDAEHRHALLRGLMQTAFLADQALADAAYYGAAQVLVVSASSKTAIAFAECAASRPGLRVTGLTSARNLDFVRALPCYAQALSYDALSSLDPSVPSVIVDMAGNLPILAQLHQHFQDALKHSMAIGRSHNAAPAAQVAGAVKPQFFFAPTQAQKLLQTWGSERYFNAVAAALQRHVENSKTWLELETLHGPQALRQAWEQLHAGQIAPSQGLIATLSCDRPAP